MKLPIPLAARTLGLPIPEEDPSFRYFNPSIAVLGSSNVVSLRAINLERSDLSDKFYALRPHGKISGKIILCDMDNDWNGRSHRDVASGETVDPNVRELATRLEDMRLLATPEGKLAGLACLPGAQRYIREDGEIDFHPSLDFRMCRVEITGDRTLVAISELRSPFGRLREKNWAPFFHDGRLHVVYQWNPVIVLELRADGTTPFARWSEPSPELSHLRGGSPGLPTAEGYLFVVHRRYRFEDKVRFAHRFIELGRDLLPRRISEEFYFFARGAVEYAAGLAEINGEYAVTFGLSDALPFVARISKAQVERMLGPLANPVAAHNAALHGSAAEQRQWAAVDFPPDPELGRVRLAKLGIKAWWHRRFGRPERR